MFGPSRRVARRTARRTTRRVNRRQDMLSPEPQYPPPPEQQYAPPPPAAAPAAPAQPTYVAELEQLALLKQQGLVTEQEYEAKKKQILGI